MYKEIHVSLIRVDARYSFDIYLKIHDSYRLFAGKGAHLTKDHINVLRSKDTHIFVIENEWDIARKELFSAQPKRVSYSKESVMKKADIIYTAAMDSIKVAYHGLVPKTVADVEKNADDLVKVILSDEGVINNLKLIDTKDHFTYQHSVRVGIYATALLLKLLGSKLTRNQIRKLSTGYFLHDVGMTRVPMQVLEKRENLSHFDWKLIRMHPIWGHESIRKAEFMSIEATNIILMHHERHDGSGYPYMCTGNDIPIYARICTIADAFESLTAARPYRKAFEPFEALRIMYQEMFKEFDPQLFGAFVNLLGPEV